MIDKSKLPSRHVSVGAKVLLIDHITMQWVERKRNTTNLLLVLQLVGMNQHLVIFLFQDKLKLQKKV